jgi:hypothetical protein
MTIACDPSYATERARVLAGADARALAIGVMRTLPAAVLPPRSPGPGRP